MMAAAAATTVLLVAILARVTFNSLLAQYWPFGNGSTYTTANATRNTLATTAGAVAAAGPVTIVRIKDGANMRKLPRQHDSSQNVLHTRLRNFCSNCPVNIDQRGCVNKHGRIRRNNLAMLLVTTLTLVFLDSAHADTMVRTPAGDEWHKSHDPWAVDPSSPEISTAARQALKLVHQKKLNAEEVQWVVTSAEKRALHVRHDKGLRSVKYRLTIHQQVGGKYCTRCPNPQLIGGECSVMSVDLVHYIKKGTWLLPNNSIAIVTCHEDFLAH